MIGRTRHGLHRHFGRKAESEPRAATQVTIDLTTEARWFFGGPLPTEVHDWFTQGGSVGLGESRCDLYRVDQHADLGLKLRGRTVLELKLRLGAPTSFVLDARRDGMIERWQRWSPADERVNLDEHARWQAVEKVVVKRRFDADGRERVLTEDQRAMTGTGCDIEVVDIRSDGGQFWSFAFAAFGPLESHRRSLAAAWEAVQQDASIPTRLQLTASCSSGYPEWLVRSGAELAASTD